MVRTGHMPNRATAFNRIPRKSEKAVSFCSRLTRQSIWVSRIQGSQILGQATLENYQGTSVDDIPGVSNDNSCIEVRDIVWRKERCVHDTLPTA